MTGRGALAVVLVAVLAAAILAQHAEAKKEKLHIAEDERRFIHIESFGFGRSGMHKFHLSNFEVLYPKSSNVQQIDDLYAGLLFFNSDQMPIPGLNSDLMLVCKTKSDPAISLQHRTKMFILAETKRVDPSLEASIVIDEPGFWHFYFFNCETPVRTYVTFDLELEQYNVVDGEISYLPIGETRLPLLYLIFCLAFAVAMVVWLVVMRKNRTDVHHIHFLMTILLFLKTCVLFFEMFKFHTLKVTGEHSGWDIAFYIFTGLKGVMLFSVIILIGTGWSLVKPFLQDRDRKIIMVVLFIQVLTNVALVVFEETAPGSSGWQTWSDLLHILDLVCCCAVLIPIVWSVRHLRESASVDGKAHDSMQKLQLFRRFYLLVVCYIYFTRIVLALLNTTLPYNLAFLGHIFSELARLFFYCTAGYLFRPAPKNPYFAVRQDEEANDNSLEMGP